MSSFLDTFIRSKDIEASGFNGTAVFKEVRVQSIVVEFILTHVPQLFPEPGNTDSSRLFGYIHFALPPKKCFRNRNTVLRTTHEMNMQTEMICPHQGCQVREGSPCRLPQQYFIRKKGSSSLVQSPILVTLVLELVHY